MSNKKLGHLYVIAAPSGTGKTSLVAALLKQVPQLEVSISHTTRPKRSNETDKKNYFFIDKTEFEKKIDEKAFLEYAEVFGNYYGTTQAWVEEKLAQDIDVILEIDWQGTRQVKLSYPEAITIFILPPTLNILRDRLESRAQDSTNVIENRLSLAQAEIRHHSEYDYLVINDNFDTAVQQLAAIIISRRLKTKQQAKRLASLIEKLI